jgi:hypothetical protein
MRPVYFCAFWLASFALTCGAAPIVVPPADVTVILDVKGTYSPVSFNEMRREAAQIIQASGVRLDWRLRSESMNATFNDLVVMTFKGSCGFDPAPPLYDELGPLAVTRTANGEVQPFGEVNCDRVVNSVRSAMFGGDYARADLLVGRALGRVVAHELVHMLTKSGQHASEGVQKAALSGRQLIAASLPLSAMDVDRLIQERRLR